MDQQAETDKTERITGLGRRTREKIAKWNQMTALRFQTGGRHQTFPASLRGRMLRAPQTGGSVASLIRRFEMSVYCKSVAKCPSVPS